MAQKAEDMLSKILNKWLCNGQLFPREWIFEISRKAFETGPSPAGGQVVPGPPFEICGPHFTFGPLVAAYIQYSILKMWHPSGFWAPPAAKPGDGPGLRYPYLYPVPVWKQFLDICVRLQTHYPSACPTGKPDSDHLCCTACCHRTD